MAVSETKPKIPPAWLDQLVILFLILALMMVLNVDNV